MILKTCLSLLLLTIIVHGDKMNPYLTNLYLKAAPLHLRIRTVTPEVWIPESMEEKFIKNEPYSGVFPLQEACSEEKLNLKIGDTGTFATPYYPRNYDSNLACEWKFEGPPGSRVQLVFFDLYTQPYLFTYFDYVMVAKSGDFSTVDRMSGDLNGRTPMLVLSDANVIGVRFRSSSFFNYRGFKAQYLVIADEKSKVELSEMQKPVFDGFCGRGTTLYTQAALGVRETSTADPTANIPVKVVYDSDLDTRKPPKEHIYNGTETTKNAYPWMAALLIDDKHFCGGSLIDDQHILTAAHCTHRANAITILLGAHNIKYPKEDGRKIINITRANIFEHPEYNEYSVSYDISILRLPDKVRFTDRIKPICLPNRYSLSKFYAEEEVRVTGWGKSSDDYIGVSPVLREADVKIKENSVCRNLFRGIVTGNLICISPVTGASPCKGDSGGPLMIKQVSEIGPYYTQVGIVSFGSLSCEKGLPVGFTRVTAFLDYINEVTSRDL